VGAGRNINMGTVRGPRHGVHRQADRCSRFESREVGSVVQGQDNVRLAAGNDINIRAGAVASVDGALVATAKNDINVTAGQATTSVAAATQKSSKQLVQEEQFQHLGQFQHHGRAFQQPERQARGRRGGQRHQPPGGALGSDDAMSLSAGRDINLDDR
jgi:filamentous hemagglutinin